ARDLVMARLQLFGRHVERARDDRRLRLEIDRVAQVHQHQVFVPVQLGLQLFGRDSRDPDLPEESLAHDELPRDVTEDRRNGQRAHPVPEALGVARHRLELVGGEPADANEEARPDQATAARTSTSATLSRPLPATAPAASRTGTAGSGSPICSANTQPNTTT